MFQMVSHMDSDYDGWWRCEPGYIDGQAGDPLPHSTSQGLTIKKKEV